MINAGYFAKHIEENPEEWLQTAGVREVCSVSHCISEAADGWFEWWRHNEFGWFNRISDALGVVPENRRENFRLFAYRLHPEVFRPDGRRVALYVPPDVKPDPIPTSFQTIGFDTVSKSSRGVLGFECSPLSCSGLAEEWPVNEFCLFSSLGDAIAGAVRCAAEQPEPGAYFVVEVLEQVFK
ncbi:MAG TPA: hypothetical protein VKB36_20265 [Vicinamibacterales bacterium]|nr:hypothetical protein [Vicinamibacterales bacterium]